MAEKKIGTSRDFIIHPGETIADVLEERGLTQAELAARAGVSGAYVSNVISGKKGISANFAKALEYALGVPMSFWMNLQANYDTELQAANESETITEEEKIARDALKDVVKYLRDIGKMPTGERKDASILSLRRALQVSNLVNLKEMAPAGAFRISSNGKTDPYVLGAWVQLCHLADQHQMIEMRFEKRNVREMIGELKAYMCHPKDDFQDGLKEVMKKYGIDFSIVRNFRGAPVQGYIEKKEDGLYQLVTTIRGAYADIFWFSLFHEIGHIVNGDIGTKSNVRFLDYKNDTDREQEADCFARDMLLPPESYHVFLENEDFSIQAITSYASSQRVIPGVVIGRLQREKQLLYSVYNEYRGKYV